MAMSAADRHARTEPPTPKRKREAREKGQVARSPEVSGWVTILAGSLLAPFIFSQSEKRILGITGSALQVAAHPSTQGALTVVGASLLQFLELMGMVGGIIFALGLCVGIAQVGWAASIKAMRPRFSRISPRSGLKNLFSTQALWTLVKSVVKLVVLSAAGYVVMHGVAMTVADKSPASIEPIVAYAGSSFLTFIRLIAVVGVVIGLADYGSQRKRINDSLKMTKEEVRDERRQQTGDPHVRARLRRRAYMISHGRTIAAVKSADVVVTNPTHVAVALQYDVKKSPAPRLVAKGIDELALRIREEALGNDVPVVEDPPLARYLNATCEVDQTIPPEIYVAVAKLIAFVYMLPERQRQVGVLHPPHSVVPNVAPDALPPAVSAAQARWQRAS